MQLESTAKYSAYYYALDDSAKFVYHHHEYQIQNEYINEIPAVVDHMMHA